MSTHSHTSATVNYTVVPWQIIPHGFKNRPARELRNTAMLHSDNYYQAEKYSRNVAYLCAGIVAAGILPGLFRRLRCQSPHLAIRFLDGVPGLYRFVAFFRQLIYYQPRPLKVFPFWHFPPLGHFLLNWSFCMGLFLYCLSVQPWYRLNREWGSPPLAIRAGMLANGLFPILFALSTKVNLITMLTAISHERLQLYHQWIGRLLLLFSIIHCVPFIWQPLHEGGLKDLQSYWYSDPVYWNGSVAFGILIWIIISGSRFARNWKYEFFVINHIFSVLLFLSFYFVHTNNYLKSWRYSGLAAFLWAAAVFIRWCQSSLASHYFVRMKASVEVKIRSVKKEEEIEGEVVRIAIDTPIKWKPGQHVFLRFPTLAPLQSHPFTIVTLSHPEKNSESQVVCIARVLKGNTLSLRNHIEAQVNMHTEDIESIGGSVINSPLEKSRKVETIRAGLIPAIIDGPYGADGTIVASYQSTLFIVGGLGLSFALPIMMSICRKKGITCKMRLVWSIKTTALLDWFEPFLTSIFHQCKESGISIDMDIHITQEEISSDCKYIIPVAKFHASRPEVTSVVKAAYKECEQSDMSSLAVVTCGPAELMRSTANVASSLQAKVARRSTGVKEVYLIHEAFGW